MKEQGFDVLVYKFKGNGEYKYKIEYDEFICWSLWKFTYISEEDAEWGAFYRILGVIYGSDWGIRRYIEEQCRNPNSQWKRNNKKLRINDI